MTNVIEFPVKKPDKPINMIPISLELLKGVLCLDDYIDFLEACIDNNSYRRLDPDMQLFVDSYINFLDAQLIK